MITETTTTNDFGTGTVKSWASIIDDKTLTQAEMISRCEIVEGHTALMPDAHFGYGPPVGTAMRTKGGVMPYAVGVDIGCGMIAGKTNLKRSDIEDHENNILGNIRALIPSGVGIGKDFVAPQFQIFRNDYGMPELVHTFEKERVVQLNDKLQKQFGTLGAGNHFVEVCIDSNEDVWFVLHSGSRGIGNVLATAHAKDAQLMCVDENIQLEHKELSYFPTGTPEAVGYIEDMVWAQEYAFWQRQCMMDNLFVAVHKEVPKLSFDSDLINCHHNYAEQLKDGTWLTRKGAINAELGVHGIIPGSMGTETYIVEGLGNKEALETSPHGAGRVKSRGAARRELDVEEFKQQMTGRAWLDRDAVKLLDEAPAAYKPIETVIHDSRELIKPLVRLIQLINYKGL